MNRVCSYTCAMLMAGIQLPAIASFFDSSDFEHLDDDLLALVSGQDRSFQTKTDLYRADTLQRMTPQGFPVAAQSNQESLSLFNSVFQFNEKGQLTLQINQDVVSIGVIECSLSIHGFSEVGKTLGDQIKFN